MTGLRSKILIANPSVIKLDTCQRHLQKEVSICWQPSSSHLVQHRPLLPLLILSLKSEQWHVHNRIHCRLCLTVTDGWHFHKKNEAQQLRDEMKNLENSNKALAEEIAANARENTRNNISSSTPCVHVLRHARMPLRHTTP